MWVGNGAANFSVEAGMFHLAGFRAWTNTSQVRSIDGARGLSSERAAYYLVDSTKAVCVIDNRATSALEYHVLLTSTLSSSTPLPSWTQHARTIAPTLMHQSESVCASRWPLLIHMRHDDKNACGVSVLGLTLWDRSSVTTSRRIKPVAWTFN